MYFYQHCINIFLFFFPTVISIAKRLNMALQTGSCQTNCTNNTISIEWQGQLEQINKFIVKYRPKDSKVAFAMERTSESKIQISNLASETFYEIKIFKEDSNGDESLLFKTGAATLSSSASQLLKSAKRICNGTDVYYRLSPVNITNLAEGIQSREFCKLRTIVL